MRPEKTEIIGSKHFVCVTNTLNANVSGYAQQQQAAGEEPAERQGTRIALDLLGFVGMKKKHNVVGATSGGLLVPVDPTSTQAVCIMSAIMQ